MTRAWFVIALALWSSMSSAQVRDGANAPVSGSASIQGAVFDDARQLVRRAVVSLGNDSGLQRTVITDADGRFSFSELAAGRYTLSASKAAYIRSGYGARRPGRPGTTIVLGQGQQLANVNVTLARGAVITGTIRNAQGEPAAGVPVQAARATFSESGRSFVSIPAIPRAPVTDDRGMFRLFGLEPGDYIVSAMQPVDPNANQIRVVSEAEVDAADRNAPVDAAPVRIVSPGHTYFPGVFTQSDAAVLNVDAGQERHGVDFSVRFTPTVSVEGMVSRPDSASTAGLQVSMVPRPEFFRGDVRSATVGGDGAFRFNAVSPGEYFLGAAVREMGLSALTSVVVSDRPVSGATLALQPAVRISGRVVLDADVPASSFTGANVQLRPLEGAPLQVRNMPTTATESREFWFTDVPPGRYLMSVRARTPQSTPAWTTSSILVNGQDIIDSAFEITGGSAPPEVIVRVTGRIAGLSGVLQDSSGQPLAENTIMLFPVDQRLWMWQSRRIKTARPSSDGAYAFTDVPPGEYYVAAVSDVEPNQWFDPIFLGQLVPASIRIVIGEGERKVQDIRER